MPIDLDTERQLQVIATEVRERIAALGTDDYGAAIRRFVAIMKASTRETDRDKIRDRARLVSMQGGKCAVCFVAFAESPPATRSKVTDRLLCNPCARESKLPPPPR